MKGSEADRGGGERGRGRTDRQTYRQTDRQIDIQTDRNVRPAQRSRLTESSSKDN
jgi:hypothetical protein